MNLMNFVGKHPYNGGSITFTDSPYFLQVVPSLAKNPSAPNYQLVFKHKGHPSHNTRLSGLFPIPKKVLTYKGDVFYNGKKQSFVLELDKVLCVAIISR